MFVCQNVLFGHQVLCHTSVAFCAYHNHCPQKWTPFGQHKNRDVSCHTNDMQDRGEHIHRTVCLVSAKGMKEFLAGEK